LTSICDDDGIRLHVRRFFASHLWTDHATANSFELQGVIVGESEDETVINRLS
jgi:hypothetical protein